MYCKNCGKQINENAQFCINCGALVDNKNTAINEDDKPSTGFAVLGFFIPIVGLILYIIYEREMPNRAKSVGKGALIGFVIRTIIAVILTILSFVLPIALFGTFLY